MRIRINEPATWRPDATRLYHFGEYRIPEDMPLEVAERALAEGAAELVQSDLETKPADQALETKPAPQRRIQTKERT